MTQMLATLHSHRAALLDRDAHTERRLAALYRGTLGPVQSALDDVTQKLAAWQHEHPDAPKPPTRWLYDEARLHQVQLLMQRQADAYAHETSGIVASDAHAASVSGAGDGLALLETTLPRGAPQWTWGRPSERALDALGRAPYRQLFAGWGHTLSQQATQTLFAGIALGRNPTAIARDLTRQLGMTYSRAVTIARTSTMRAYSAGTLATYRANSDVCEGWIWVADLSTNTCAACLAMNGSEHALDEDLDDHPNGRCAKVPKTRSWAELLGEYGIDTSDLPDTTASVPSADGWFDGLSAADQRQVLGPSKYDAFTSGNLSLSDLVGTDEDPLWGPSIYEKPLKAVAA